MTATGPVLPTATPRCVPVSTTTTTFFHGPLCTTCTITETRNCTNPPPPGTGAVIIGRWVREVAIETDDDDDDEDDDDDNDGDDDDDI